MTIKEIEDRARESFLDWDGDMRVMMDKYSYEKGFFVGFNVAMNKYRKRNDKGEFLSEEEITEKEAEYPDSDY